MGELVGEQAVAGRRAGRVRAGAEDEAVAEAVGDRALGARGSRRAVAGVDAHAGEVVAERALGAGAHGGVERAPGLAGSGRRASGSRTRSRTLTAPPSAA